MIERSSHNKFTYPVKLALSLICLILFAGCLLILRKGTPAVEDAIKNYTYYFMVLMTGLWIAAATRIFDLLRKSGFSLRPHVPGIIFCVVLTVCIGLSTQSKFRVLADEANLVSVSKSMLLNQSVENVTQGRFYYNNYNPTVSVIGKRPYLYPFLTSILHHITGYRVENGFLLNQIVLLILLMTVYFLFHKYFGVVGGLAAVLLVAAQPIVASCANTAGFDLISAALFILVLILASKSITDSEQAPFWFYALCVHLVLYSHTRYESVLISFFVFFFVLISNRKLIFTVKNHCLSFACMVLLSIPIIWQRSIRADNFEQKSGPAFSSEYLAEHIGIFLKGFIQFDHYLPYASAVNIIGAAGLVYILKKILSQGFREKKPLILTILTNFIILLLFLSYYSGFSDQPYNARFFIIPCITLSLFAAYFMMSVLKYMNLNFRYILIPAVLAFLVYLPVSIEDRLFNSQLAIRQYDFMQSYFSELEDRNILVITDRPVYLSIHNYGSISFSNAKNNSEKLLRELNRHLYRDIYAVQFIEYKTGLPPESQRLPEEYKLIPVDVLQHSSTGYLQISRSEAGSVP